jgi:hypothetical protein
VAKRIPRYDNSPLKDRDPGKCWVPEYVEETI